MENKLGKESSLYLKQHASNPINWFPWGSEALNNAKENDKLLLISVGYSSCHWCHVMEHESFDNEEVASYLNDHFVSIKLDREQRPDIDEIYMTGLQLMTGQGGWPMSSFVTAEGKPFFAGTYFPPDRFLELLQNINLAWQQQRDQVLSQAEEISERIRLQTSASREVKALGDAAIEAAIARLTESFDATHGGFGLAPKFPNESQLWLFASRLLYQTNEKTQNVLIQTLDAMARGGIYDHLAGGFHRYSTDEKWLVPHFEKMLYNQSQLVRLYTLGLQFELSPTFHRLLSQTLEYLKREMMDTDGGIYSATDADSEGKEGTFFIWSHKVLRAQVDERDLELLESLFGVSQEGNFEGANVLHLTGSLEDYAEEHQCDLSALKHQVSDLQTRLLTLRGERPKPFLDKKVIAAWNGQLVTSLVDYEIWTGDGAYRDQAIALASALWDKHFLPTDRKLMRSRLGDTVSIDGTLEDYAFVAEAFFNLHLLCSDRVWFERGQALTDVMLDLFWDSERGGFYAAAASTEGPSIVRSKNPMDGATPSGNAVALSALLAVYEASGNQAYKTRLEEALVAFSGQVAGMPSAHPYMLSVLQKMEAGSRMPYQWAADGNVWLSLARNGDQLELRVRVAPKWHINHPDAERVGLKGLLLRSGGKALPVSAFPVPVMEQVAFFDQPIPVLPDKFSIAFDASNADANVSLTLQVCSQEVCLAPQQVLLRVPAIFFDI